MENNKVKSAFTSALSEAVSDRKVFVLALLAHNITISVRGLFMKQFDWQGTSSKLYALNEIQHRIASRLMHIALKDDDWSEESFADFIFRSAKDNNCEREIILAVSDTLSAL